MHLSEGDIRTYLDGELSLDRKRQVDAHLAGCSQCRAEAETMESRGQLIEARFAEIQPGRSHPMPVRPARALLEERIQRDEKEKLSMFKQLTSRMSRTAWAAITVVAVLAVALAFPSVRAAGQEFLRLFRVQQVQVISVDAEQLPGQLEASGNLEALFSNNVQVDEAGDGETVTDAAEASAKTGLAVRLPENLGQPAEIYVQPGGKMSFTLNVELLRAVLQDLSRTDIILPDSLNGQVVRVNVPAGVAAFWGDCPKPDEEQSDRPHQGPGDPDDPMDFKMPDCTSFIQIPTPSVSAPHELDVTKLGEVYLELLGMSSTEAAAFSRNVDWTSTFVFPVPRDVGKHREVTVDGVSGNLIHYARNGQRAYALLWIKDGILYALSGPGTGETALETAASLK